MEMSTQKDQFEKEYREQKKKKLLHENQYDVEKWCNLLKGNTFDTTIMDLTLQEANAIVQYYNETTNHRGKLTKQQKGLLNKLQKKIDGAIRKMKKKAVFVRLGPRRFKFCIRVNMTVPKIHQCF